jgi:ribosomal protein S6
MAADSIVGAEKEAPEAGVTRIYEVGYHIVPTVAEDKVEGEVSAIRSVIEKNGGSFIAEGAPALMKLSYEMWSREGDRNVEHDRAYFGWIKFESTSDAAKIIETSLKQNQNVLRFILFRTVREETRARIKMATLREVKRTDTIKVTPRKVEEPAEPVSEEDLDKALQDITVE